MAAGSRLEKWYWIAGIAAAIFAGFALFEHSDKGAGIIQSGENNTQIVGNQGTVILDPRAVADNEPVDIDGAWSRSQSTALALAALKRKVWDPKDFGDPPYLHKFVSEHSLVYKDHQSIVITFQTTPDDFECHACVPYLSFFEFEERHRGWKLINSDIGVVRAGGWGSFPPEDISVRVIGENIYGVFLKEGFTGQGVTVEDVSICAKMGDSFKEVLFLEIAEADPDGGGWSSTITPSPTTTGLYDLVVDRVQDDPRHILKWENGPERSKEDVADYEGNIRTHDVFKFDGNRYMRSDVFR